MTDDDDDGWAWWIAAPPQPRYRRFWDRLLRRHHLRKWTEIGATTDDGSDPEEPPADWSETDA